jgi:hypothetical protein
MKNQVRSFMILAIVLSFIWSEPLQAQAQPCSYGPELGFINYQLESGTDKKAGATYRFFQVLDSVDALITIGAAENAALVELDITSTGTDSAFQPRVQILDQSPLGAYGYMNFLISFVVAGTNTPTSITAWKATALDIDGDNYRLRESVCMEAMSAYTMENASNLDMTCPAAGMAQFDTRNVSNLPGITVNNTFHMVTAEYFQRTHFTYQTRIIADPSWYGPSSANARMFSLNFNPCLIDNYTDRLTFPVEWLSFEGRVTGEEVVLDWSTASELNNDRFAVERTLDGQTFETIGIVPGQGTTTENSHYQFIDLLPQNGLNYYRLKQVDLDGQFAYSHILSIKVVPAEFRFSLYPNPASETLHLRSNIANIARIDILNLNGQILKVPCTQVQARQWEFQVGDLPPGTYLIKVETEKARRTTQRFVIY